MRDYRNHKPASSCAWRGDPRGSVSRTGGYPRLDGPKGIPYRHEGAPVRVRGGKVVLDGNKDRRRALRLLAHQAGVGVEEAR